jgi:hypothetical protein
MHVVGGGDGVCEGDGARDGVAVCVGLGACVGECEVIVAVGARIWTDIEWLDAVAVAAAAAPGRDEFGFVDACVDRASDGEIEDPLVAARELDADGEDGAAEGEFTAGWPPLCDACPQALSNNAVNSPREEIDTIVRGGMRCMVLDTAPSTHRFSRYRASCRRSRDGAGTRERVAYPHRFPPLPPG